MSFRTGWVWKLFLAVSVFTNIGLLFYAFSNQTDSIPNSKAIPKLGSFKAVTQGNVEVPVSCPDCDNKLRACLAEKQMYSSKIPLPFFQPSLTTEEITDRPKDAEVGRVKGLLSPVDAETQDAMLCEIARRTARERWLDQREKITASLITSLKDLKEQERNVRTDAKKFASILGLSDNERIGLEKQYREIRLERMQRVLDAIQQEPPDYQIVFQQARGLFSDEDNLLENLFGPQARDRIRTAELEGRTAILAIIASFAGMSWEQVVGW